MIAIFGGWQIFDFVRVDPSLRGRVSETADRLTPPGLVEFHRYEFRAVSYCLSVCPGPGLQVFFVTPESMSREEACQLFVDRFREEGFTDITVGMSESPNAPSDECVAVDLPDIDEDAFARVVFAGPFDEHGQHTALVLSVNSGEIND